MTLASAALNVALPVINPEPETPPIPFELPQGLEADGRVYRQGSMRLATGADELRAHKAAQALDNTAYGVLLRLARVVTLTARPALTADDMGELFMPDLNYLIELYNDINPPRCRLTLLGELPAIP
jgi:hypothetical protein